MDTDQFFLTLVCKINILKLIIFLLCNLVFFVLLHLKSNRFMFFFLRTTATRTFSECVSISFLNYPKFVRFVQVNKEGKAFVYTTVDRQGVFGANASRFSDFVLQSLIELSVDLLVGVYDN